MKRATTPKHTFSFNVDPDASFAKILIIYAQNGKVVLEKSKEDLTFEEPVSCDKCSTSEWQAWLRLTQEETNRFEVPKTCNGSLPPKSDKRSQVTVQVRVLSYGGEALASDEKVISLYDVLDDQVLSLDEEETPDDGGGSAQSGDSSDEPGVTP